MRSELNVPVDGKGLDWSRKVANAIRYLLGTDRTAEVAALQAQVADHEARIAALETP